MGSSLTRDVQERVRFACIEAVGTLDALFKDDQNMTYVVFCINRDYPKRHLMFAELSIDEIRSYLDELEADLEEQGDGE